MGKAEEVEKGKEGEVQCGRSGKRVEEVSSPPPIRELSCSDVWLAITADRQIAANDMCWESSQRWANDRRGEAGRWLPSGKYTCSAIPMVCTETTWTFGIEAIRNGCYSVKGRSDLYTLFQRGRLLSIYNDETMTFLFVVKLQGTDITIFPFWSHSVLVSIQILRYCECLPDQTMIFFQPW